MASNQTSSPLHRSTRQEVPAATQAQGGKAPLKLTAPAASTLVEATTKVAASCNTRSLARLAAQPGEPPLDNDVAALFSLRSHTRERQQQAI
jgi:hypothetical protein